MKIYEQILHKNINILTLKLSRQHSKIIKIRLTRHDPTRIKFYLIHIKTQLVQDSSKFSTSIIKKNISAKGTLFFILFISWLLYLIVYLKINST